MNTAINMTEIYNQYSAQIFGYLNWAIGNHHDAEELTNDVFLKIMRLQENPETKFDVSKSAIGTYVRTVTDSVRKDYYRTNHQDKYKAVSDFSDADGNPFFEFKSPEKADKLMERQEVMARISKAIQNLPPKYKEVAELRFEQELKFTEMAEIMGCTVGTAKGTTARCRELLKAELQDLHRLVKTSRAMSKADAEEIEA